MPYAPYPQPIFYQNCHITNVNNHYANTTKHNSLAICGSQNRLASPSRQIAPANVEDTEKLISDFVDEESFLPAMNYLKENGFPEHQYLLFIDNMNPSVMAQRVTFCLTTLPLEI